MTVVALFVCSSTLSSYLQLTDRDSPGQVLVYCHAPSSFPSPDLQMLQSHFTPQLRLATLQSHSGRNTTVTGFSGQSSQVTSEHFNSFCTTQLQGFCNDILRVVMVCSKITMVTEHPCVCKEQYCNT